VVQRKQAAGWSAFVGSSPDVVSEFGLGNNGNSSEYAGVLYRTRVREVAVLIAKLRWQDAPPSSIISVQRGSPWFEHLA
jgi:hypothetical protein